MLKGKIISNKSELIRKFNAREGDCGYQGGVVKDFIRNSIASRLFYFILRGNWFCLRSLMSIYFFDLTFIKINRKHVKYKFNLNFSIKSPWTLTWPTHFHFRLNTVSGQDRTGGEIEKWLGLCWCWNAIQRKNSLLIHIHGFLEGEKKTWYLCKFLANNSQPEMTKMLDDSIGWGDVFCEYEDSLWWPLALCNLYNILNVLN